MNRLWPISRRMRVWRSSQIPRWTQEKLALAIGISRRRLIDIETGKSNPHTSTRDRFYEMIRRHKEEHGRRETKGATAQW